MIGDSQTWHDNRAAKIRKPKTNETETEYDREQVDTQNNKWTDRRFPIAKSEQESILKSETAHGHVLKEFDSQPEWLFFSPRGQVVHAGSNSTIY